MKIRHVLFNLLLLSGLIAPLHAQETGDSCSDLLNHQVNRLVTKESVNLCDAYAGKVLLIVNTASKCAFTGQYEGLETLYETYQNDGLVVLGFPSNDFGNQEPGNEQQIQNFCRLTYGVRFPMFQKSHVTERNADPLFRGLGETAGEYPSWNFHKYLIDRDGNLAASYGSFVTPQSATILNKIKSLL